VLLDNTVVIIRSVGERTESLCYQLATKQVPAANVVVIHERPFVQAVARGFEIGLDYNLPWTLCLDADYLLATGTIAKLVTAAEKHDENVFKVQGESLDKFFGGPVWAGGHHLYRTSLLRKARQFLPFNEETLRPETCVLREMKKIGHPLLQLEAVSGLHAYEQYYRDIYRQMSVRAHKHRSYVPYFLQHFQKLVAQDDDYKAATLGLIGGLANEELPAIDITTFPAAEVDNLLQVWGLREKKALDVSACEGYVEQTIESFVPSPEYLDMRERMMHSKADSKSGTVKRSLAPPVTRLLRYLASFWKQTLNNNHIVA
jgi:hypothetical protein